MSDDKGTVADPTILADAAAEGSRDRAVLVLYDEGGGRSRIIDLPEASTVVFGRSRSSTVHIDIEGVSRRHCQITRKGGIVTLEDLGSRNGTRRNGERIEEKVTLRSGDEVTVGPITAVYVFSTPSAQRWRVGSGTELEDRLAAEVDRGRRYKRRCSLLLFRIEGGDEIVDQSIGEIVGRLRSMDGVAEFGPDEIAVIAPELSAEETDALAARLATIGRTRGARVRVGTASFPEDATRPDDLIARARAALRTALSDQSDAPVRAPQPDTSPSPQGLIVRDPQMQRVFALVEKVAATSMTVLINGETGVGKEAVAASVHARSPRSQGPFVRLNCASLPETLLESELFGHEKGAFTGAEKRKKGYFEAADGGTLLLDEIGEISAGLQAKLLRVLEEHKFNRVGGTEETEVDVRVVCATNRDLEKEVREGHFREDLFFRISAFTILVPPLRARREDIIALAEHFIESTARDIGVAPPVLTPGARHVLYTYSWPGNVRQLRNAIERAVVLAGDGSIEVTHLPDRIRDDAPTSQDTSGGGSGTDEGGVREQIADLERQTIVTALEETKGNQTHAAKRLGLSRRALIYKMEKYGLKKPPRSRRETAPKD